LAYHPLTPKLRAFACETTLHRQGGVTKFLLFLLLVLAPAFAQDRIETLTILHSNDLHAHLLPDDNGAGGFAQLATVLRQERAHCAACLYLNAGDLVQGTPVSTIFRGMPIYEVANKLGIDASTLGNHEFDYGWQNILRFVKAAHFPVICANMVDETGNPVTGKPYVILTAGGIRVAVIGVLMSNMVGTLVTPKEAGPWHVLPLIETVRRCVHEVRDRSELIVVLGHIRDEEAAAILRDVPDVSVLIVGHSHRGYPELKRVDGRVAAMVRAYGVELGRLDLQVNLTTHKLESAQWKRIAIDSKKIAPAPDVLRDVARWEAKVSKVVDVRIGESKRRLAGPELSAVVERAMAEGSSADIGYINGGNLRDVLPAGEILARHIWNILPFDDRLVVLRFKGSQLPALVTAGRNIDPEREYTVVTTDYAATMEFSGRQFLRRGGLQRDVVIDWIKKRRVVD
jgi:2',3'-cyclic-nucleotide 2'-phosphodiesterase (5'-nucleotidase family)